MRGETTMEFVIITLASAWTGIALIAFISPGKER